MWQRWNGTSHIFEKSDDNGSTWAPLPLDGTILNQGIIPSARFGNPMIVPGGVTERGRGLSMGEWGSYTPGWGCSGGVTTLGNGSIRGYYTLIGKTCHLMIELVYGSTTLSPAGYWYFLYPPGVNYQGWSTLFTECDGVAEVNIGAFSGYTMLNPYGGGGVLAIFGGNRVGPTVPLVWANNNSLTLLSTFPIV